MPPAGRAASFTGFPRECVSFYRELRRHNDQVWFARHRAAFEAHVMEPSRRFVEALGDRLRPLAPGLQADPRVNRSIFRIQRDTRFSPDKTPYKTHLGIWLWEGPGPRMECSGFYFQLEPPRIYLGVGIYLFPRPLLAAYREALCDRRRGKAFARAVAAIERSDAYAFGGRRYRRVPRGCAPGHPLAEYLLHDGLYAGREDRLPESLHSAAFVEDCAGHFEALLPLHRWLRELTESAAAQEGDGRQPAAR